MGRYAPTFGGTIAAKLNQVFMGCPFKMAIRRNYERLREDLQRSTPLSFVLADTGTITSGNYLLDHIFERITESVACIFDVTDGNPNVSLEVGLAHAYPIPYLLAAKTRKPRKVASQPTEVKPIISDLQGKNRIEYRVYRKLREQVESRFLPGIPYYKRWQEFVSGNKGLRKYGLEVMSEIREKGKTNGPRVDSILDGSGISRTVLVGALRKGKLLSAKRGAGGGYFLSER